jgi:hypothetical protein
VQKEAERPVFASSSGRRRRLVRLTSGLVAVGMVALITLVTATMLSSGHDSPPPWPVITIWAK